MSTKKEEGEIITGHEYDGIHELDNPLPRWWLATFYLAIIFSIFYFAYYILGSGPTLNEELQKTMAQLEAKKPKNGPGWKVEETELLALAKDPSELKKGEKVFKDRCVSCHGEQGQGIIGPNLTDNFWIHGKGTLADIAQVVHDGVNDKGMPQWGAVLKEEELDAAVIYVKSLKGSHPQNPKAPQGDEVKE
jgi:cytochrome c oxidase cbb3-type subunit 3